MKIGLLSDSHHKTERLSRAIDLLVARGAEHLVHCGDVCEATDLLLFREALVPASVVAGNMDTHRIDALTEYAALAGIDFAMDSVAVEFAPGEHLIATHGHFFELLEELILGGAFPYVCHGHTHVPRDERIGRVRVLNPGAIAHPRSKAGATVALLDTDTDTCEWIAV